MPSTNHPLLSVAFRSLPLLGVLGLAARPARATSSQAGTSAAQFLKIGAGSRAGAMADAYTALGGDAFGLYYNPALATLLRESQLAAAHTAYFQGSNYEAASFAYPLPFGQEGDLPRHVVGIGIYNLAISDIERRSTTESQTAIGTFGAGDYSYNLTYGYRYDKSLALGGTGKVLYQTIDSYSATSVAVDLGAHYTPRPDAARPISYAAVLRNFGTRPSFAGSISDPLPLQMTLGAGWKAIPKRLNLELDVSKYRDTNLFFNLGTEYTHAFSDDISGNFRFGYTSERSSSDGLTGVAFGVGINFHRASFDFAWIPFGDLGDTFRYSLLVRFGGAAPGSQAGGPPAEPPQAVKPAEASPVAETKPAAPAEPARAVKPAGGSPAAEKKPASAAPAPQGKDSGPSAVSKKTQQ